jgi:hypothetical protein
MDKSSSVSARAIAATALVCGFVVLFVVVVGSLGRGDSHKGGSLRSGTVAGKGKHPGHTPASYVVEYGDTLTSIAHKTGVSVARIRRLNPGIDPQILISGEKLKLR